MSLLNRSCSLFAGLALWCSPMAGSAQLSGEAKEKGGALGSKTPKVEPAHRTGFSDIAPYLSADGAMLSFYDTREIVADADEILSFITKTMVQQATKDEGTKTGAKILNLLYETSGAKSLAEIYRPDRRR
jgi:hypothetical protein